MYLLYTQKHFSYLEEHVQMLSKLSCRSSPQLQRAVTREYMIYRGWGSQSVLKSDLKIPRFVPFRANLTQFVAKRNLSECTSARVLSERLSNVYLFTNVFEL